MSKKREKVLVDVTIGEGMKYGVFTAKHTNGFCMFDTKTTDFNAMLCYRPYDNRKWPNPIAIRITNAEYRKI